MKKILCLNWENEGQVGPTNILHVKRAILNAGWELHIATVTRSANQLLQQHRYEAGLALLNPESAKAIHGLMESLSRGADPMEWLALLPAATKPCAEIRNIILEFFFDYHTLPLDIDRLLYSIGHAIGMHRLKRESASAACADESEHEMVGTSASLRAVFHDIRKIASVDASVLIAGESGTGKELAARAIHERSHRSTGPFVAVNCAALPTSIAQSELFGHERGAFTGAQRTKIGFIESAMNGTLLLDEIGDLPPELQVYLLRFLQESVIHRIGSTAEIPVDVRVIAATHVNLDKAVAEGRFRQDLYFRLNVLNIKLPPLRDRREDIELLAKFFYKKFTSEKNCKIKGISPHALRCMSAYSWPGNVRELINRIRRAMVMCDKPIIGPSDLGLNTQTLLIKTSKTLEEVRNEAEQKALASALQHAGRNLSQVARMLDISRPALYRLLSKHGYTSQRVAD